MSNSSSKVSVNCDEVHRGSPSGVTGKSKPFSCGQCGRAHKPKSTLLMVNNALSAANLIILSRCVEVSISFYETHNHAQ